MVGTFDADVFPRQWAMSPDGRWLYLTEFLSNTLAVVIANATVEATRLALESLGVGSQQFGSPQVGNLMAHLASWSRC